MNIFREKILFILSALSLVIFITSFLILVFQVGDFSLPVVLHFDGTNGIDLYGSGVDVWIVWTTSLLVFIANTLLSNVFYFRERSISYIVVGFNFLWAILALLFAGVITSSN